MSFAFVKKKYGETTKDDMLNLMVELSVWPVCKELKYYYLDGYIQINRSTWTPENNKHIPYHILPDDYMGWFQTCGRKCEACEFGRYEITWNIDETKCPECGHIIVDMKVINRIWRVEI